MRASLLSALVLICLSPSAVHAGFLIGAIESNDHQAAVLQILDDYNDAHPSSPLPVDIELLAKTDDNSGSVFANDSDFEFFSDASGNTSVDSATELHKLKTAWFSYDGSENILYYSVKSSQWTELYAFSPPPAVNLLQVGKYIEIRGKLKDISHVSFWTGEPPEGPVPVPEPASALLVLMGGATLIGARRWRRSNCQS